MQSNSSLHLETPTTCIVASSLLDTDTEGGFAGLGIDARLCKALYKLGYKHPTLIQSACIRLAAEGRDVLAKSRTGSGKTAAYCIPILQKLLGSQGLPKSVEYSKPGRASNNSSKGSTSSIDYCPQVIILVPTKELCDQVTSVIKSFLLYCTNILSVIQLSAAVPIDTEKNNLFSKHPNIIISTPARLVAHLQAGSIVLSAINNNTNKNKNNLEMLVIDEADLLLSFGYEGDMKTIKKFLPLIYQCFLMSATLSSEIQMLKSLMLSNAAIIKLEEPSGASRDLSQYYCCCNQDEDKYLLIYSLISLSHIHGKILFFVNDIATGYRLKLFLEQFSIQSAVLNSELPVNSRKHIIDQFNRDFIKFLIATDGSLEGVRDADGDDDNVASNQEDDDDLDQDGVNNDDDGEENDQLKSKKKRSLKAGKETSKSKRSRMDDDRKSKSKKIDGDSEYGSSRGVDFVNVAVVINVDAPLKHKLYIHRIGRTARGGAKGMALSLFLSSQASLLNRFQKKQSKLGGSIECYPLSAPSFEGLRYRVSDGLRRITKLLIKQARVKELQVELVNSQALLTHFEDNPMDLATLKHDLPLSQSKLIQPHLKTIPSYLMTNVASSTNRKQKNNSNQSNNSKKKKKSLKHKKNKKNSTTDGDTSSNANTEKKISDVVKATKSSKNSDPLKSFSYRS